MSVFIGAIKSNPTDKDFNKYVNKSLKLIKGNANFNNEKDIAGISQMFAMDMARDFHGPLGEAYRNGYKKYTSIIIKKVKEKL